MTKPKDSTGCSVTGCVRARQVSDMCDLHYRRSRSGRDVHAPCRVVGDDAARFWSKVTKTDTCWLWTGSRNKAGYGDFKVRVNGSLKVRRAHRWLYELEHGQVPDGLELDHLCRVPRCVRPEHLEPVTHRENMLRGQNPTAENARRTHCTHGHSLTAGNIYRTKGGARDCRLCRLAAQRARYHANIEASRARSRAWAEARKKKGEAQCG